MDYLTLVLNEVPETFNQLVLAGIIKHSAAIGLIMVVAVVLHYALRRAMRATKPTSYHDDNVPYVFAYAGLILCWLTVAITIPINIFYLVELFIAPRAYFIGSFF